MLITLGCDVLSDFWLAKRRKNEWHKFEEGVCGGSGDISALSLLSAQANAGRWRVRLPACCGGGRSGYSGGCGHGGHHQRAHGCGYDCGCVYDCGCGCGCYGWTMATGAAVVTFCVVVRVRLLLQLLLWHVAGVLRMLGQLVPAVAARWSRATCPWKEDKPRRRPPRPVRRPPPRRRTARRHAKRSPGQVRRPRRALRAQRHSARTSGALPHRLLPSGRLCDRPLRQRPSAPIRRPRLPSTASSRPWPLHPLEPTAARAACLPFGCRTRPR